MGVSALVAKGKQLILKRPRMIMLTVGILLIVSIGGYQLWAMFSDSSSTVKRHTVAKQMVETALRAWQAGDSYKKFETDHPELEFLDSDWSSSIGKLKLLGYRVIGVSGNTDITVELEFAAGKQTKVYNGFTKVANLSGGMIRWRAAGLPTG